MINLNDIKVEQKTGKDGSIATRAVVKIQARNTLSSLAVNNAKSLEDLQVYAKEAVAREVWGLVYGDLSEVILALVYEANKVARTDVSLKDLQLLTIKLESLLK